MDFIPKVMMLLDNGYKIFPLGKVKKVVKNSKKINKIQNRDVYIVDELVYKLIDDGLPEVFWSVLNSGFYGTIAPILAGPIMDGERAVGYVAHKCTSLHIGHAHVHQLRFILKKLYLETGFVFSDFHSKNFGQYQDKLTILDLESVVDGRNTKDKEYQLFIDKWK